jgi:release factor glutamine methyltransferase
LLAESSNEPAASLAVILSRILNIPKHYYLSHPEYQLSNTKLEALNDGLEGLLKGIPLPYLTGEQEFFGIDFHVNQNVMIPRPETELLITTALKWLLKQKGNVHAADIGTGTGCISIAISRNYPDIRFTSTDRSFDALKIARKNVSRYNLNEKIFLVQTDLLKGIGQQFDCIFANLPYIPSSRLHKLAVSRFEPELALDGGSDGFRIIEKLLKQSRNRIKENGFILLEIDDSHSQIAEKKSLKIFPSASIRIMEDLAGKPRLLTINV